MVAARKMCHKYFLGVPMLVITILILQPIISLLKWKETRKRRREFVWVMLASRTQNGMQVGAIHLCIGFFVNNTRNGSN